MITGIVTFYSTVLFVHVMAVVIGFGAIFVYPILWRAARARDPRSLPYLFTAQSRVGQTVIGPATVLILLTGIYLVADGPYEMSASFISVALPILVALILMGPFYFGRTEDKLAELAERDIAASAGGEVTFSEEYESRFRQLQLVSRLASLAILVALFFMVVKP
jgi:uncharacterized membrane protein